MSVRVMSLVFNARIRDIEYTNEDGNIKNVSASTAKIVLLALADHANDEGEGAYPSIDRLQQKTSLCRRAIIYALNALKSAKLISYEGESKFGTTNYTVRVDVLEKYICSDDSARGAPLTTNGGALNAPGGVHSMHLGGALNAPESSINHPINHTDIREKTLTKDEYIEMTKESLVKGYEKYSGENSDRINQYPEDVRIIITAVCDLFNLQCPSIKSKHAGLWISESRELRDACGEFESTTLREIANDFEKHMNDHHGTVPFTIASPSSLVNAARAKSAVMRTRKKSQEACNGANIPRGASVHFIGGKAYVPGLGEVNT